MLNRRGLLTGLGALIAAPAIVRAGALMPVRRPALLVYDREWIRRALFPDDNYVLNYPLMLRLQWAENEIIRVTAIPPEQFYRSD